MNLITQISKKVQNPNEMKKDNFSFTKNRSIKSNILINPCDKFDY